MLLVTSAVFLIASAAACCGMLNPASRLYGKWKLDVAETVRRASENNPLAGAAGGLINMAGGEMTIEFQSDGTATVEAKSMFGSNSESGTWSLAGADGDTLTIDIVPNDSGQSRQMTLRMVDADTFETEDAGQGESAVFRRVKE